MKIAYVVLHYQNYSVTKECIESLINIKGENSNIIIVDNFSPNNTGNALKKIYENEKNVHVILLNENKGFARGNNVGFHYAKDKLKSNIIIVMNNDVIIDQIDFESKLLSIYKSTLADIIAPDIVTPTKVHQNPHRISPLSNIKVLKRCIFYQILLIVHYLFGLKVTQYMLRKASDKGNSKKITTNIVEGVNIVPHGACIIYTKEYILTEDIAYLPVTFLFSEEDILYDYVKEKGYKIIYSTELNVNHFEDASINDMYKKSEERMLFNIKNRALSLRKLLLIRFKMKVFKKRRIY